MRGECERGLRFVLRKRVRVCLCVWVRGCVKSRIDRMCVSYPVLKV